MVKFIIGTFLILGWAFYEASGGAAFQPELRADIAPPQDATSSDVTVTRASTNSLSDVARPVDVAAPAIEADLILATAPASSVPDATIENVSLTAAPQFGGSTTNITTIIEQPEFASLATSDISRLREVAGARVNMRAGPSTDYAVLDTLPQGTQAEVLDVDAEGWARVQIVTTGQIGWMAERLLTDG